MLYTPPAGNAAHFNGAELYTPPTGTAAHLNAEPTPVVHTIAASGGDYTSLAAWEAAQQRDLVAANEIAIAECEAFEDTASVGIMGWTSDASRRIIIRASQSHGGAWSTGAYRLVTTNALFGTAFFLQNDHITLQGLQIHSQVTGSGVEYAAALSLSPTDFDPLTPYVVDCILRVTVPSDATPVQIAPVVNAGPRNIYFINTIFMGCDTFAVQYAVERASSNGSTQWYYNCTFAKVQQVFSNVVDDLVVKNCLYTPAGVSSPVGFSSGTYNAASTHNASTQASGTPGASARNGQVFTFANATAGDFRLSLDDTGARGFGTNLSADGAYAFAADAAGHARTGTWDIGANSAPATVVHQIAPSGGDYTSLAAWEAAQQRNLVTAHQVAIAECQSMTDAATVVAGWTTDLTRYVHIRAASGHGVSGPVWNTSRYRISNGSDVAKLDLQVNHARVTGLYLEHTGARWQNSTGLALTPSADGAYYELDGCYFRSANSGGEQSNGSIGFALGTLAFEKTVIVRNCVSFGAAIGFRLGWVPAERAQTIVFSNLLASGGETGEGGWGFWLDTQPNCTERVQNCVGFNHSSGDFFTLGLAGTAVRSHNASSDATAWGTSAITSLPASVFINAADGDFRIRYDDTVLGGAGTSLAAAPIGAFSTDISGFARTGAWDIGPCQAPTLVTHAVASAGGDYSSLAAWESAQQRDLVAVNEVALAECGAFLDTAVVEINGWTTDEVRYPFIRAAAGAEAQLPYSTSAYRLEVTNPGGQGVLATTEDFTRIERIQIQHTLTFDSGRSAISARYQTGAGKLWIDRCVIRGVISGTTNASAVRVVSGITVPYVSNTVALDYATATGGFAFEPGGAPPTSWFYNCSAINCIRGFQLWSSTRVKNCLYDARGLGSPVGFSGTSNAANTNNASSDASAPGASARTLQTFTYVDADAGDFRLASTDVGAKGFGINLSTDADLPVTTDVLGVARTLPWDIGASVFIEVASGSDTLVQPSANSDVDGLMYGSLTSTLPGRKRITATIDGDAITEVASLYVLELGGALVQIADESVDLDELQLAVRGLRRLATEGLSTTEAHLALRALLRLVEEAVDAAESEAHARALLRLVAESTSWTESLLPALVRVRLRAEGITSEEAVSRTIALLRTLNELFSHSETLRPTRIMLRLVSDASEVSDARLALRALTRLRADSESSSEARIGGRGRRQLLADPVELTEARNTVLETVLQALVEVLSESMDVAEATHRARGLARALVEAATFEESQLALRAVLRRQAEGTQSEEVTGRSLGLTRRRQEAVHQVEQSRRLQQLLRRHGATLSLATLLLPIVGRVRGANESLELSEAVNYITELILVGQDLVRVVQASLELEELGNELRTILRKQGEAIHVENEEWGQRTLLRLQAAALDLLDAIESGRAMRRQSAATLELEQTLRQVRALSRTLAEAGTVAEAYPYLRSLLRLRNETLPLAYTRLATRALNRLEAETLQASEARLGSRGILRRLGESLNLSETLWTLLTSFGSDLVRVILAGIQTGETHEETRTLLRRIAELEQAAETRRPLRALLRRTSEALNLAETSRRVRALVRRAADSIGLTAALDKAAGSLKLVQETVQQSEGLERFKRILKRMGDTLQAVEAGKRLRDQLRMATETVQAGEGRKTLRQILVRITELGDLGELARRVYEQTILIAVNEGLQVLSGLSQLMPYALIGGRIVINSAISGALSIRDRIKGFLRISRGV